MSIKRSEGVETLNLSNGVPETLKSDQLTLSQCNNKSPRGPVIEFRRCARPSKGWRRLTTLRLVRISSLARCLVVR